MPLLAERTVPSTPRSRLFTAYDLENMPSEERYELIRGELYEMPNNSAEHGRTTFALTVLVGAYILEHDLGEGYIAETRFIVETDPDTILGPDLAFVTKERAIHFPSTGYLRLAPDLVLETRSPSDRLGTFNRKIAQWLEAGVKVVWALDPASRTLTIHKPADEPVTLSIDDTLTCEELLPGFAIAMRRVFRLVLACD